MKLQDYIHYYIGCQVLLPDNSRGKLFGISGAKVEVHLEKGYFAALIAHVKPILRKLGDYEGNELNEYNSLVGRRTDGVHSVVIHYDTPATFNWLLKKGFDLFGLIDAGLAIDSKTLK